MPAPNAARSAPIADQPQARLLTTSCTTGWLDWVHGTFWLCPDGLLRVSLGLATTIEKSTLAGQISWKEVARQQPTRDFTATEIREFLATNARNLWISWNDIHAAAIRYGMTTDRIRVTLLGGRSQKILWPPTRAITNVLRDHLEPLLGPALRVEGWPWRPW